MDQGLAVEGHLYRLGGLGIEAVAVGEIVPDAVEHADAMALGGQHHAHQPGNQVAALVAGKHTGLLGDVVGAHDQALQPRLQREAPGDDLVQAGQRFGGLHHRPQARAGRQPERRAARGQLLQVFGAADLGQQYRVRAAAGRRVQVLRVVVAADRVDPYHRLAVSEAARREGLDELAAGGRLHRRGHGVLQIEDDGVGVDLPRLGHRPLVDRGDVHRGTAWLLLGSAHRFWAPSGLGWRACPALARGAGSVSERAGTAYHIRDGSGPAAGRQQPSHP